MSSVDHAVIEELKVTLNNWGGLAEGRPIGITDRFLVYQDLTIRDLLDIKVFLRTSKEESRTRRFERPDYKGSEMGGEFFWRTEDYFEMFVWPNYMREHEFLFEDADEGKPQRAASGVLGIFA